MARQSLDVGDSDMELLCSYQDGLRKAMAMKAACDLELFDKISETPNGVTATDLAQTHGWHEQFLRRLMDTCVAMCLLAKEMDDKGEELYQLASPARYLVRKADVSVWEMSSILMEWSYTSLAPIAEAIKSGKRQCGKMYNKDRDGDDHCHADDEHDHDSHAHNHGHSHDQEHHHDHGDIKDSHLAGLDLQAQIECYKGMSSQLKPYVEALLKAFDLSKYKSAVDLGAGDGVMAFTLCHLYPEMHVYINDLPFVCTLLENHMMPEGPRPPVTFLPGDFFKIDLPKSDLFISSNTTHHFTTEQLLTLFKRVYEACNTGGSLVLIEKTMKDDRSGPATIMLWDLMLINHEGEQRTGKEYSDLIQKAGFSDVRIAVTNDLCQYDVIRAVKA